MGVRGAMRRLGLAAWAAYVLLGGVAVEAANTRPKAPHLVYKVAPNAEIEIEVRGYDQDGNSLTTVVTGLPAAGSLFDLSQVYAVHGQRPKAALAPLSAAGSPVPALSKHRLIYRAPGAFQAGTYATLRYTVSDGQATSAEGLVRFVADTGAGSDLVLVESDFADDSDGWRTQNNGASSDVTHERSSVSSAAARLNQFVYAEDGRIDVDARTGADRSAWYFVAPGKFLGNQVHAYGGNLQFVLGAFSGDFSAQRRNSDLDFIVLECASCSMGKGMRFARKLSDVIFDGSPSNFKLRLSEGAWLKDPKNTLAPWSAPTQCEMVEMLSSLSAIKVLGDFTTFYESVGIDSVQLTAAAQGSRSPVPLQCLCANPGTQCS
jgi:hypothetical protein